VDLSAKLQVENRTMFILKKKIYFYSGATRVLHTALIYRRSAAIYSNYWWWTFLFILLSFGMIVIASDVGQHNKLIFLSDCTVLKTRPKIIQKEVVHLRMFTWMWKTK